MSDGSHQHSLVRRTYRENLIVGEKYVVNSAQCADTGYAAPFNWSVIVTHCGTELAL